MAIMTGGWLRRAIPQPAGSPGEIVWGELSVGSVWGNVGERLIVDCCSSSFSSSSSIRGFSVQGRRRGRGRFGRGGAALRNSWLLYAVLVIARSRSGAATAGSADLAKTCAVLGNARGGLQTGSNSIWRILIVRYQLPTWP